MAIFGTHNIRVSIRFNPFPSMSSVMLFVCGQSYIFQCFRYNPSLSLSTLDHICIYLCYINLLCHGTILSERKESALNACKVKSSSVSTISYPSKECLLLFISLNALNSQVLKWYYNENRISFYLSHFKNKYYKIARASTI